MGLKVKLNFLSQNFEFMSIYVCVRPFVNPGLARAITCDPFKLG